MIRSKGFWILLGLTVIAVTLSILDVRKEKQKEEEKKVSMRVLPLKEGEEIVGVEVVKPSERAVRINRINQNWVLVEPVKDEVDQNQVTDLVNTLQKELYEKEITLGKSVDYKVFGLDQPEKTHRIRVYVQKKGEEGGESKERVIELIRGQQKNYQGKSYVKLRDDPRVWLVGYNWDSAFDKTAFDLRNKRLFGHDVGQVNQVKLISGKKNILLKKVDNRWMAPDNPKFIIDATKVSDFLNLFTSQVALEFKDDGAGDKKLMAQFGLDKPEGNITLYHGNPEKPWHLIFGRNDKEGTYYFWLKDEGQKIVRVAQSDYSKLKELDWRALRDRRGPFEMKSTDVKKVHVRWQDRFVDSEKRQGEWTKISSSSPELAIDPKKLDTLIDQFSVLTVEEFSEDLKVKGQEVLDRGQVEFWNESGESLGKWTFGSTKQYEVMAKKKSLVPVKSSKYQDVVWISEADFNKLELDRLIADQEKRDSSSEHKDNKK
ncbi:MAG: DUF4340 domain-containing protein [Bdellovibrionaceae bacterium]|nr:DUF4340 domain-containing protein [Pseudobdellovibrionaceae bacterium]MDW8190214.1 DUF4340 domain-containing protein [Pseudobdellovibrionaceae bacterium]